MVGQGSFDQGTQRLRMKTKGPMAENDKSTEAARFDINLHCFVITTQPMLLFSKLYKNPY